MEKKFIDFLNTFTFDQTHFKRLKELLKRSLGKATKNNGQEIERLKKQIQNLNERQTGIIEKNLQGIISDKVLSLQIEIIEKELEKNYLSLSKIPEPTFDYRECLAFLNNYLKNPGKIWRNASLEIKTKLQWFQFPQGLTFENNIFGTTKICLLFKLRNKILAQNSSMVDSKNHFQNNANLTKSKVIFWQEIGKEIESLAGILKEVGGYP